MTLVKKSALAPYSAHEMFSLVADIESYGAFLPWCAGARVLSTDGDVVVAALDIAYSAIQKTFTTKNHLVRDQSMEMNLVDGPFKHLRGYWGFHALDATSCKISFELEFEFSNRLLGFAFGPGFNHIAESLVDSFHHRAEQIYGKR